MATGLYPAIFLYDGPATAANVLQPLGLSSSLDNLVDNNPNPPERVGAPAAGWAANSIWPIFADSGGRTRVAPVSFNRGLSSGSAAFVDPVGQEALYGKAHVIPPSLDLGNVLSAQVRQITIWNAQFNANLTVSSVANNVNGGIAVSGISPPVDLAEQSDVQFTVTADTTGPPVVSGSIDVTTSFAVFEIEVSGQRVTAFQFVPEIPVQERLEFSTDIIPSEDNSEQRRALRNTFRQVLTYKVAADDPTTRGKIKNLIFDWQASIFGVPLWFEASSVTAAVSAASTTINAVTAAADWKATGLGIIYQDEDNFEIFEISSFNATSITTSTDLVGSYSARSVVAPVRLCYAGQRISAGQYLVNADEFVFEFTAIDNDPIEEIAFASTYNGLPIFDDPNAVTNGSLLSLVWNTRFARTEFAKLKLYQEARDDRSSIVFEKTFAPLTKALLWEKKSWLQQLKGSQGVFYLPTFAEDFSVAVDITSASTTIDFVGNGYTNFVDNRAPLDAIRIVLNDGTVFLRDITGSSEIAGPIDRISIDSALGQDVAVADIDRVEYLLLCRMDGDQANVVHRQPGAATLSFPVKTVRA